MEAESFWTGRFRERNFFFPLSFLFFFLQVLDPPLPWSFDADHHLRSLARYKGTTTMNGDDDQAGVEFELS